MQKQISRLLILAFTPEGHSGLMLSWSSSSKEYPKQTKALLWLMGEKGEEEHYWLIAGHQPCDRGIYIPCNQWGMRLGNWGNEEACDWGGIELEGHVGSCEQGRSIEQWLPYHQFRPIILSSGLSTMYHHTITWTHGHNYYWQLHRGSTMWTTGE